MADYIDKEAMRTMLRNQECRHGLKGLAWVEMAMDKLPTISAPQWISVEDRLPKLPDRDWCSVMVITVKTGDSHSHPMIYERAIVRGKRVERWKYHWDRIADESPDYWMPMPEPPEVK